MTRLCKAHSHPVRARSSGQASRLAASAAATGELKYATTVAPESPMERTLRDGRRVSRKDERAEGSSSVARNREKERIMSRTRLAAMFMPLFITVAGAASASVPVSGGTASTESAARLSENFSVLHAASQWSVKLSEMAGQR